MRKHTGRSPSKQLPAVRIADGVKLMASVAANQGGLAPDAIQKSDDGILHIDLTRGHFDITLHLDGQEFGNTGGWGSDTLGSILGTMERSGYRVHCCLTCAHYKPSGMIDEWSLGAEGYCVVTGEPDMDKLTHMLHVCKLWAERRDGWFGHRYTNEWEIPTGEGDLDQKRKGRHMTEKTQRGLSKGFMDDLQNGLLSRILKRIQEDPTLLLEIRDDYISVYYRGGSVLMLSRKGKGKYKATFDSKYYRASDHAASAKQELLPIGDESDVAAWLAGLPARKHAMDLHFGKHPAEEREVQQAIVRSNNSGPLGLATDYYFCDIEYKTDFGEFDMVGVHWPSDPQVRKIAHDRRLVLMELKYGDAALAGDAGLRKHVLDLNRFLEDAERLRQFKREMINVFNQKRHMGLVKCGKDLVSFSESEQEKPMLLLILADHNPEGSALRDIIDKLPESPHAEVCFATASFMGYGIFDDGILTKQQLYERCGWATRQENA